MDTWLPFGRMPQKGEPPCRSRQVGGTSVLSSCTHVKPQLTPNDKVAVIKNIVKTLTLIMFPNYGTLCQKTPQSAD